MPRRPGTGVTWDGKSLAPGHAKIIQTMLDLEKELERWPQQTEIVERVGTYTKQNLSHAMRTLEKRGIITPVEIVPNTVTDMGKELLKAAKRKARK